MHGQDGGIGTGWREKNVPILCDEGFGLVPGEPIKVDRSLFSRIKDKTA